jgi:hypothetical protein
MHSVVTTCNLWSQHPLCGHNMHSVVTTSTLWSQHPLCGHNIHSVVTTCTLWSQHPLCGYNMHIPKFSNSNSHHSSVICDNFKNNSPPPPQHTGKSRCNLCYCHCMDQGILLVIPLYGIMIISQNLAQTQKKRHD